MSKDAIVSGVGAGLGLFSLTLIEKHVIGSGNDFGCVAAPLAATAAMIFADRSAADIKNIVGGYVVAGAAAFVVSKIDNLPAGPCIAVAIAIILQAVLKVNHAPAIIVAFAAERSDPLSIISPAAIGAAFLIGIHHLFLVVRDKAKLD